MSVRARSVAETAAQSGEATPVTLRLGYVVGRLDRALRRHVDEAVRPYGLTWQQYTLLSVLRARSGLSNAQLARRSFITPQSMSEIVSALVKKGFIRREADPTHGRILRTELTEDGLSVLEAADDVVTAIEEQMLHELTPRERERLIASLRSCVRMLGAGLTDI
jgi:DNA-binding MarR family transcriptional regulator